MEAIGRLAGGVAHDFNNLLTPVIGYGRLVLEESDIREPYRSDIKQIVRAGERATDLTRKLLAFGRKQVIQTRPLNLNRVVMDMEHLLRRSLGTDIDLVLDLEKNLGAVRADPGQLEQVILNLGLNARDAMAKGGRLMIRTRTLASNAKLSKAPPDFVPGEYVQMTVRDTGAGMSEAVRERAFEPFFSTKEKDKGSGLGLSTAYGIIKQFKGYIDIRSRRHAGTTVDIYLPRVDEAPQDLPVRKEIAVPRGKETVLLIEDEDTVRETSVRMLESLGYTVLAARNGGEALLVAEQYKGAIDLLLSDVVMPRLSGPRVARRLRKIRKDFKVLFTSGYAADTVADLDLETISGCFIQKPFTRETLGLAVRKILDQKP
jgi:CheY-like chemotaxis protein